MDAAACTSETTAVIQSEDKPKKKKRSRQDRQNKNGGCRGRCT